MSVVSKEELKDLVKDCLLFKRHYFEHLTLSYKVMVLKYSDLDVSNFYEALNKVELNNILSVNEQFLMYSSNYDLASKLVETDDVKLLKYGYEVGLLQIQSELLKLSGLVNGEKLLKTTNDIKLFMTKEFENLQNVNLDIQNKISYFTNEIEELFIV